MKYSKEFIAYWDRIVIRNIAGKMWLIDPQISYCNENAIILESDIKCTLNHKASIPDNIVQQIFEEFLKINDKANFTNKRNLSKPNSNDIYPWKVGIELTGQCNFDCIHCYAKPLQGKKEPSFDSLINLLDNLCDSGVLFLWFTGGECTLRKDFIDIYTYAKRKGFVVSIVTNGSFIPKVVATFNKYPPKMIKVSQYGSSEEEYIQITGSANNYNKFLNGIDALSRNNLNFVIQTVLLKENYSSLNAMRRFCNKMNSQHNINPVMAHTLDGNSAPKEHEIEPECLDKFIFSEKKIINLKKIFDSEKEFRKELIDKGEHFCNVGISECFISLDFKIHFCVMFREKYVDYRHEVPFKDQFQKLNEYRKETLALDAECKKCNCLPLCHTCPYYKEVYKKDSTLELKCLETKKMYDLVVSN
ncbi:MAG: radical SAM protein [Deltaproteobacteria bacterium]|nr:radical SAM protein [Deltaproteobacteria bacterium]